MPDNSTLSTVLMLALMAVAFWFLLIRPAQKKQKAQQEMVSTLAEGVRVMTTAGILGTIRHMGEKQAIVEIAPGVEMTLLKQAILRVIPASEEEFEYDDDSEEGADDAYAVDGLDQPVRVDEPQEPSGFERPDRPENTSH